MSILDELKRDLDEAENRLNILLAQIGNARIRDANGKPLHKLISDIKKHVASISRD
jgi:hypothetical protein